jgi:hypothetical protein
MVLASEVSRKIKMTEVNCGDNLPCAPLNAARSAESRPGLPSPVPVTSCNVDCF